MKNILLIDDDTSLCDVLVEYLGLEGFACQTMFSVPDSTEWLEKAARFDVIILDVMLAGKSGFDVLRQLKAYEPSMNIPVIMLSAKGDETSRVVGLELGADDYIAKPFSSRELIARIGAVSRRFYAKPTVYRHGTLVLNVPARLLSIADVEIALTAVEAQLMECLLQTPGQPVSRDHLSQACLGHGNNQSERAVDMHISRIRKKLEQSGEPDILRSVRGKGYAFDTAEAMA